MTKDELLAYLMTKRTATAGVAVVQQNLNNHQNQLNAAKLKLRKTIIGLWVLTILVLLTSGAEGIAPFLVITIGLMAFKYFMYIRPAQQGVAEDQSNLQIELKEPKYVEGAKNFPEKFYNYSDAFRLWKLVSENRVDDLHSAFNLLETQHFQEDQLATQEEIKSLQQDIAGDAHLAAISSTVSAINSFRK